MWLHQMYNAGDGVKLRNQSCVGFTHVIPV